MRTRSRSIRTLCPHCHVASECVIDCRPVAIEFRGKTYQSEEEFVRCGNCAGEFDMLHLVDPLARVYDEYRREHGYPSPHEIRAARERMSLTEAEFGRLLGICARTVRLYERGALPTDAHAEQLKDMVRRQFAGKADSATAPLSTPWRGPSSAIDWFTVSGASLSSPPWTPSSHKGEVTLAA